MLKATLTDPSSGISAKVIDGDGEEHALVVAVRPLKTFRSETLFFLNDTYGVNMNIDASPGGTPEEIHNGIDSVLWTGSNIIGNKAVFNSSAQSYAGSQSVLWANPNINDVIEFDKGSSIVPTDYTSLTMWIYIATDWGLGDSIGLFGWDTTSGIQIGDSVFIENYFNISDFGSWQKITIPITDFNYGLSNIDSIRMQVISRDGAKSPTFYMDVIEFEETGTPIEYVVRPKNGTWLYVNSIKQIFVDALDTALLNSNMYNLSYNKILGVTLGSGYNFQLVRNNNKVTFSINLTSLSDLLQLPNAKIENATCDGTNTMLTIKNDIRDQKVILKSENNDFLRFTISEDLTGFLMFRSVISGYSELRSEASSIYNTST
jgi:hypothetical protein